MQPPDVPPGKEENRMEIISGRKYKNPESTMRVTIPRSQLGRLVYCHYTNDAKAARKLPKLNISLGRPQWTKMESNHLATFLGMHQLVLNTPTSRSKGVVRNK